MAAKTIDALASFVHLEESLPNLLERVVELAAHVKEKHAEFAAEYERLLEHARPKRQRQRTPSLQSIHSDDECSLAEIPSSPIVPAHKNEIDERTSMAQQNISPLDPENRYLFANSRRKRKPGSSIKSGASGPSKSRNKHAVIIYYDSHAQEVLESMVKSIGVARNNLRKGKMSHSLNRGLRLPAFDKINSLSGVPLAKKPLVPRARPQSPIIDDKDSIGQAFDIVDVSLEAAQTQCEKAAHQFLRDGDCQIELRKVTSNFTAALDLAKSTTETLRKEQEEEAKEQNEADDETTQAGNSSTFTAVEPISKLMPIMPEKGFGGVEQSTGVIEVDDDDEAPPTIEIDMSKFRMARAGGRTGGGRISFVRA